MSNSGKVKILSREQLISRLSHFEVGGAFEKAGVASLQCDLYGVLTPVNSHTRKIFCDR